MVVVVVMVVAGSGGTRGAEAHAGASLERAGAAGGAGRCQQAVMGRCGCAAGRCTGAAAALPAGHRRIDGVRYGQVRCGSGGGGGGGR